MTLLSDDSDDSSDSAHCPTSETETTSIARDNEGIAVTLLLLLTPTTLHSNDSADCSDFAFATKNIYVASDGVTVPRR